jgi:hypothetical protein
LKASIFAMAAAKAAAAAAAESSVPPLAGGAGAGVGTAAGVSVMVLSSIAVILELTMFLIPSVTTSRSSTRIFLETVRTPLPVLVSLIVPRVTSLLSPLTMREVLMITVLPLRLSARSTRIRVLPLASLITLVVFSAAAAVLAVGAPKAAPVPIAVKPKVPRPSAVPRASALEAVEVDFFFLDILVPPKEIVNSGQVRPFVSASSQGLLAIG